MGFAFGLLAVFGTAVVLGGLAALFARLGRPPSPNLAPPSDALLRFEPRAGRHRLPVRAFDGTVLTTLTAGIVGFLLFVADHRVDFFDGLLPLSALTAVPIFGVWWSWRRGVFRPPRQSKTDSARREPFARS